MWPRAKRAQVVVVYGDYLSCAPMIFVRPDFCRMILFVIVIVIP